MSRDNQERLCKQEVLQEQQMCGVSNAFWPADVRCRVHTNKVAQLRRICIMMAIECINIWGLWKVYWQYLTSITMSLHRLIQISHWWYPGDGCCDGSFLRLGSVT